jgi:hypothetical protein
MRALDFDFLVPWGATEGEANHTSTWSADLWHSNEST